MKMYIKKINAVIIILLFLLEISIQAYAEETCNKQILDNKEKNVMIYRVMPDTITPITLKIEYKDEHDLDTQIMEICTRYTNNDREIQEYINNMTLDNNTIISYIKSYGRGIIYKIKIPIIVKNIFKKFPNLPPYNKIKYINNIHANYRYDQKAYSIMKPIIQGNQTIINGPHQINVIGFIGYTTWVGLIAERGIIFRCGFTGYGIVKIS
ncbi:MAG: hypothetical protein QXS02_05230 [Candidatus Thermoplasmatota archaeon]